MHVVNHGPQKGVEDDRGRRVDVDAVKPADHLQVSSVSSASASVYISPCLLVQSAENIDNF